jgi:hypothetical protein
VNEPVEALGTCPSTGAPLISGGIVLATGTTAWLTLLVLLSPSPLVAVTVKV